LIPSADSLNLLRKQENVPSVPRFPQVSQVSRFPGFVPRFPRFPGFPGFRNQEFSVGQAATIKVTVTDSSGRTGTLAIKVVLGKGSVAAVPATRGMDRGSGSFNAP